MRIRHGGVRRLLCLAGSSLLLTTAAIAVAAPASAVYQRTITSSSWAYTDSRHAQTSYVNTPADSPVGSWRDPNGKHHKSRAYFSYDLTGLHGQRVTSAVLGLREVTVNDCSRPRALEVWRTTAITSTTSWANPPAAQVKVADIGGSICPVAYLNHDITEVFAQAVAGGQASLTLEVRVPASVEGNVQLGRTIGNRAWVILTTNTVPLMPTAIALDGKACGAGLIGINSVNPTVTAQAALDDPYPSPWGDPVYPAFAIWPTANPQERVEWETGRTSPGRISAYVPAGILTEGETFSLSVRIGDGLEWSPWSEGCEFVVDTHSPESIPTITSTDYPESEWGSELHGGVGIPGSFTFSANGDTEVTGFFYGVSESGIYGYVAADEPGGSATVQITPTRDGSHLLTAIGVDFAGNTSMYREYWFGVRPTAPVILDADAFAWAGVPHRLTFYPSSLGASVVSYVYRVDDGPEQTVAADSLGRAEVSVVPALQGSTVYLRSVTGTGFVSPESWTTLFVFSAPFVESADFPSTEIGLPPGETGTFTVNPHMHNVVEYVYQFNRGLADEQPAQTVAADSAGRATIPFTPARPGFHQLTVYSRTAQGAESQSAVWSFHAASIAPVVTSDTYPPGQVGGGVGVSGRFTFSPATPNVVEYTYQFENEPAQTVAAGPDGSATIDWTPPRGDWFGLTVTSRSANGLVSDQSWLQFGVRWLEPLIEAPGSVLEGQQVTATFTAQLAGSTHFVYSIDGGPEETVPANPQGAAQVTWTPSGYATSVTVFTRTATGLASGYASTTIWIISP